MRKKIEEYKRELSKPVSSLEVAISMTDPAHIGLGLVGAMILGENLPPDSTAPNYEKYKNSVSTMQRTAIKLRNCTDKIFKSQMKMLQAPSILDFLSGRIEAWWEGKELKKEEEKHTCRDEVYEYELTREDLSVTIREHNTGIGANRMCMAEQMICSCTGCPYSDYCNTPIAYVK